MKNLHLTPPLLLITMGYPGSGKTFFARQFAENYSLPRISEEIIRFELFEKPLFNVDEDEIIERIINYALTEIMKTKQTIVCDGSYLTHSHRKRIYDLAAKNSYRTLTVWLQTDIETSTKRALIRDKRNIDNKYEFSIDKQTFKRIADTLQRPTEKEQAVVISGKHAFRSQCLTVLRKITSIYSEELVKNSSAINSASNINASSSAKSRINNRFIQ